jgi:glycosyltransferase involved in cell wall biosynthesis
MKPLRLLLAFSDPPYPQGGAPARSNYALLRGLVERGHRVTSWVAYDSEAPRQACAALFPAESYDMRFFPIETDTRLRSKLRNLADPHGFSYSSAFRADLDEEMRRPFDVFYATYNWGGWLGARHRDRTVTTILHLYRRDVPSLRDLGFRALLTHLNRVRAERRLLRAFPNFIALTDRLQRDIRRAAPRARTEIIPLCLDLNSYRFEAPPTSDAPTLGLIGSFGWGPTFTAAKRLLTRLWPAIQRRAPEARLLLVGRSARRALGPLLGTSPGIEVHENVAETEPFFRRLNVMLYATDAGSGMKVKVMEAFAFGTPVITNADGVEGLPAMDGVHVGLAEDDETLVEKTLLLLRDGARARLQSENARELLERCCSPRIVLDAHEELFRRIALDQPRR